MGLGAERLAGELVSLTDFDPALRRQLELIALEGNSAGLAAEVRWGAPRNPADRAGGAIADNLFGRKSDARVGETAGPCRRWT